MPAEPPPTLTPDEKVAWYAKQKQTIELRRKLQDETRDQALQQDRARAAQVQETAGTLAAHARQQEQFADQAAASAAKARERVLNPAIARQEQQASRQKEREDESLSRLAARARAAGYTLDQAPGGDFSATKTGNIGPSSKRLAEALVAEAKAKFADQQKKERDQLAIDAARAAVESQKLLKAIETNTKAGPIV